MIKILIINALILISFSSFSQTCWKVENEYGDEILLTIELNKEKNTFEAYSRKDALKDLAGVFTYTLAKAAGKLKYAEIVFIEGKTQLKNDSLYLKGNFNYFDKQFLFTASVSGIHFNGEYTDNRNRSHLLSGLKVPDCKPIRDYGSIISSAFSLTEKNIFNPLWLKSDEWIEFKRKVNSLKYKISDDYELAAAFFWLGKKLPFSPYELNKKRSVNKLSGRKNGAGIRELKTHAVLFDANTIPSSQKEMDSIAVIIAKKGVKNLVVDLRGNNRLTPVAANILLNYLSDKPFLAGVYLTRKWNDNNNSVPRSNDLQKIFRGITDMEYNPGTLYREQGWTLKIVPSDKTFKGRIYVLADSKSSKVAEMLIYTLKSQKIATLVGQKTAGATLLTEYFAINTEYDLVLPDCDFFTPEGKSLNKIGVEPDIQRSGDEVMKYILSLIE